MKKKNAAVLFTMAAVLGMTACGEKDLELTTDEITIELGSEIDTTAAGYVADADIAAEATADFSAVDVTAVGTYTAVIAYKGQTAELTVVVEDTTAPVILAEDMAVIAVGEPLYASDIITGITELSGEVEAAFVGAEDAAEHTEAVDGTEIAENTEAVDGTEIAEDTEAVDGTEIAENTEAVNAAELVGDTESAEDVEAVDGAESAEETEFVLDDVVCSNAAVVYTEVGEYENTLVVTDQSGNSTKIPVHILVGDAPELSGVEDLTVAVGTPADEIDYLGKVTATDSNGNDVTVNIVCDFSAVDTATVGEYEIIYTVTDQDGFTAAQTATVAVEEESGKKPGTRTDAGKTDAKTDSSKKDSVSTPGNSNSGTASAGTSGISGSGTSGSSNASGSNSGASGNNGSASGNSNASGSGTSGNSGDNSGNSTNGSGTSGSNVAGSETSGNSGSSNGAGSSGNSGNSGDAGSTGTPGTDTGNAGNTATDNSNSGNTSTDAGSTDTSGTDNSGSGSHIDPDSGMSVPDSGFGTGELDPALGDNTGTGGTGTTGGVDITFN